MVMAFVEIAKADSRNALRNLEPSMTDKIMVGSLCANEQTEGTSLEYMNLCIYQTVCH